MIKRPLIGFVLVLVAAAIFPFVGCTDRETKSGSVAFVMKNWNQNDQHWFSIHLVDSVIGVDSNYVKRRADKAIRFTVLDMVDGATVEWLEMHLMTPLIDTSGPWSDEREWVQTFRIVYHCDPEGSIDRILNYPEVREASNAMIATYIDQIGMSMTDPVVDQIVSGFSDSAWVVSRLMSEASLIHALFGIELTHGDTLETLTWQQYSEERVVPYLITLNDDPFCREGEISIKGWGGTGNMDLRSFLSEKTGPWPLLDTVDLPMVQGEESMEVCFDTSLSLPNYLLHARSVTIDNSLLAQRVTIELRKDWSTDTTRTE